jgi:hypothetical protein
VARTHRDVTLPALPPDAWALARNSGAEIPAFRLEGQDPHRLSLRFSRGFGWSNPVDVFVTIWQSGPTESTLRYEASILALADPFDFMQKNLDRFEQHLRAHHHAWMTGTQPPPAPLDRHSVKVNLVLIGLVLGFVFLMAIVVGVSVVTQK